MKTPYGDATYIETPEMRKNKAQSNLDELRTTPYNFKLGGTGGGDYLQLGSRLQQRGNNSFVS
jgi:hypothetical protein